MSKEIEIKKGSLISNEYIERKKQEAIALMKYRYPECEIEVDENYENIIIKAVPRKRSIKIEGDER